MGKEAGEHWPGGGGGEGGGFAPAGPGSSDDLEQRVAALESVVYGTDPVPTGPTFIDATLRPDLIGAPGTSVDPQLEARMAAGDAEAKRVFDNRI